MVHRGDCVRAEGVLKVLVLVQVTIVVACGRRQSQTGRCNPLVVPTASAARHVPLAHEVRSAVGDVSVQVLESLAIDFVAPRPARVRDIGGADIVLPAVDGEPHVVATAAIPMKPESLHHFSCSASQILAIQELKVLVIKRSTSSQPFGHCPNLTSYVVTLEDRLEIVSIATGKRPVFQTLPIGAVQ